MNEVVTASDVSTTIRSSNQSQPSILPLLSAFQFLKLFTTWYKEKRWDSRRIFGSGGMPSSHSATVSALAVAIGFEDGIGGSSFALPIVLAAVTSLLEVGKVENRASLAEAMGCAGDQHPCRYLGLPVGANYKNKKVWDPVMYDASGVRLHAGRQAELLNQIVCEFPPEHPLSSVRPLRELLGHTPLQVIAGAILGCLVSYVMRNS
ncbi:hypothetical protein IFM89_000264 [Coptis chinensis]|uniref:Acid phosphatase/vanadium-dependent haloperoxidase-related protein n=1 Tax=Coptis chinensis TaxID=261450 RepID=A0A835LD13_9MAGN|nr:hypothetical protein IFM89_000264 [Coptis chinensis]